MHCQGVMHRDITPANIVISDEGSPCLVDFALATLFAEIHPEFTHYSEIVGTLAYLAPEATGRTGRPTDRRADFYALGATLYELATGHPPFGSGDPLRLTHDHLARVPVPPAQANRAVWGDAAKQLRVIAHSRGVWGAAGLLFLVYLAPGFQATTALKKASSDRIQELLRICNWLAAPFGSQEDLLLSYGLADTDYTLDPNGNWPAPNGTPAAWATPACTSRRQPITRSPTASR